MIRSTGRSFSFANRRAGTVPPGERRRAPQAPGGFPVIGHAFQFIRDPFTFLSALPAYGDLVRIRIGHREIQVVCSPELTHQLLLDDRTFDRGGPLFDRGREALGDGLITCTQSAHRRQRRLVQPAFHSSRMPVYAGSMIDHIATIVGSWHDQQILDVRAETAKIATDIAAGTIFAGVRDKSVVDRIVDDFAIFQGALYLRMLLPTAFSRLPIPVNRRYDRALARLDSAIDAIIGEYRAGDSDRGDLLSILLASQDAEEEEHGRRTLSDTEIHDQIVTFLFAGMETTASALAWALHLLAQNPDSQARLQSEADKVVRGPMPVFADIPRLEFTNAVITEALRLYPPAWFLTRFASADTRLGGYDIEKGAVLAYSPYLLHRRQDLFPDPDRFDPGRWLGHALPPFGRTSMVPFGGGPRKCIGDRFAVIEATLSLAAIAARWQVEPMPNSKAEAARSAVLNPKELTVRITARKKTTRRAGS